MPLDDAKIEKLRTELYARTRMRIEAEDPIFAIIALNQEVIEDGIERLGELLDATNQQFADHACNVTSQKKIEINNAAAEAVSGTLKKELSGLRAAVAKASSQLSASQRESQKWVIVAVVSSTFGSILTLSLGRAANLF